MAEHVTVYGTDWCGDTRRTLRHLDRKHVAYDYVDIDENADGERKVIEFHRGKRRVPLVEVASGGSETKLLSVPTEVELDAAIGE